MVMQIGIAVADPMTDELVFLENRVQSEKRSAAPPYVPQLANVLVKDLEAHSIVGKTHMLLMH
jgi:2-keto-4-pentenoate hydratase